MTNMMEALVLAYKKKRRLANENNFAFLDMIHGVLFNDDDAQYMKKYNELFLAHKEKMKDLILMENLSSSFTGCPCDPLPTGHFEMPDFVSQLHGMPRVGTVCHNLPG